MATNQVHIAQGEEKYIEKKQKEEGQHTPTRKRKITSDTAQARGISRGDQHTKHVQKNKLETNRKETTENQKARKKIREEARVCVCAYVVFTYESVPTYP